MSASCRIGLSARRAIICNGRWQSNATVGPVGQAQAMQRLNLHIKLAVVN